MKSFTAQSIDGIARILVAQVEKYPTMKIPPEIAAKMARLDDSLVLWQWRAGVSMESRVVVKPVIGGEIRVGGKNNGEPIILTQTKPMLSGYEITNMKPDCYPIEIVGLGADYFHPWRQWGKSWETAEVGGEFAYRNKRYQKVSIETLRPFFLGKVFNIA